MVAIRTFTGNERSELYCFKSHLLSKENRNIVLSFSDNLQLVPTIYIVLTIITYPTIMKHLDVITRADICVEKGEKIHA